MKDLNFEGIGTINSGEYNEINCEGVVKCKGDVKAERIHIEGVFSAKGKIESKYMECEGTGTFSDSIRVDTLDIEGVMTLKENAAIEANRITCEGVLTSDGEISADYFHAEGCIKAKEIVGDTIEILNAKGKHGLNGLKFNIDLNFLGGYKKTVTHYVSKIDTIEATNIIIEGVRAVNVNGESVTIGPYCEVDNVDCSGTLKVHNTAIVKNIQGATEVHYD